MSDSIKVSIIIPVYNVADYLRRCLDSCINQTLLEIEIIVINDCSPDPRDTDIMKEYEERFPDKVRCIWHENNKSTGAARNTGIRSARGEFIYCADPDDYIDIKLCEKMYNTLISENADMAVCDINRIEKNILIKNWMLHGNVSTQDLCERIRNLKTHGPVTIMIKKTIIDNNNLYFPEYVLFEDAICALWYLASPKIVQIHEALYYYCIRDNSSTQKHELQDYILCVQIMKYIFDSVFFDNLNAAVKELLLLYWTRYFLYSCQVVCINYPAEFIKFCHSILDLFKVYNFNYDSDIYLSEDSIRVKKILRFVAQNIDVPDFNFEFIAYTASCDLYYNKMTELKKTRSLLSLYTGKRLTVWGCGAIGERYAQNMSINGIEFEITDINTKIHGKRVTAHAVVKPWSEVKDYTDVVLVSARGIFEEVRDKLAKECPDIEVVDLVALLEQ